MEEGRTIPAQEFMNKLAAQPQRLPYNFKKVDLDLARQQAEACGIDAEKYLQSLLHEAVNAPAG